MTETQDSTDDVVGELTIAVSTRIKTLCGFVYDFSFSPEEVAAYLVLREKAEMAREKLGSEYIIGWYDEGDSRINPTKALLERAIAAEENLETFLSCLR